MPLLVDTCILYDWLMGEIRDHHAIEIIETQGAYVSPVSIWELVIKHHLGKLALPSSDLTDDIAAQGFSWLNVTPQHAAAVLRLPNHHRDPFDRFLLAQASYEDMRIATYDKVFGLYSPEVFIVKK